MISLNILSSSDGTTRQWVFPHFPTVKRMLDWAQKTLFINTRRLCLATLVQFVHQGCACKRNFHFLLSNQERGNYRWRGKTFPMLSAGPLQLAPRKPCFWPITGVVNDIRRNMTWILVASSSLYFWKSVIKIPSHTFPCFCFRVEYFETTIKKKQTNKQTKTLCNKQFYTILNSLLKSFTRMSRNELVCNNSVLLPMTLTNNVRPPHLERFVSIFIYSYIIYSEIIYSHYKLLINCVNAQ